MIDCSGALVATAFVSTMTVPYSSSPGTNTIASSYQDIWTDNQNIPGCAVTSCYINNDACGGGGSLTPANPIVGSSPNYSITATDNVLAGYIGANVCYKCEVPGTTFT